MQVVSLGASWGALKSASFARKFNVCDNCMYVGFISLLSYHVKVLHLQEMYIQGFLFTTAFLYQQQFTQVC